MTSTEMGALWSRFWLSPGSSTNLAALRIVAATHSLWVLTSRDYAALSSSPLLQVYATMPDSRRLRFLFVDGAVAVDPWLQVAATVALVLVLVGVAWRPASVLAAVVIYHLAPLETAMWTSAPYARGMTLAPIVLLLLAGSPAADALAPGASRRRSSAWEYAWPVRLTQLLVVQMYLFSAYGKLASTGLGWGKAENVRQWLIWFNTTTESTVFSGPGLWIADQPLLCAAIGSGTMILEIGLPFALFVPRLATYALGVAVAFHVGILFSMNIYVGEAWYLLAFVDWSSLGRGATSPPREGERE